MNWRDATHPDRRYELWLQEHAEAGRHPLNMRFVKEDGGHDSIVTVMLREEDVADRLSGVQEKHPDLKWQYRYNNSDSWADL